jgi:hypothetical protein
MPRSAVPSRLMRILSALCLGGLLAACTLAPAGPASRAAPKPVTPAPAAASETSVALAAYYRTLQASMLDRGLLRTDPGIPDAPFNARMLTESFVRVALYDEFQRGPNGYVARETASILRRWEGPVRVTLRFGDSVPEARRATERARVASLLGRLARVTGHPIRLSDALPNFYIYIVNEDERRALAPEIARAMPSFGSAEINAFTRMPPATYCQVSAVSRTDSGVYTRAFAVIRAEHPDLLHQSCLHEEIAQALGLPNDWPRARPSVFNDDQEFALLTPMDELMLRILYDPALRPGMREPEARPIVESLANALMGGDS